MLNSLVSALSQSPTTLSGDHGHVCSPVHKEKCVRFKLFHRERGRHSEAATRPSETDMRSSHGNVLANVMLRDQKFSIKSNDFVHAKHFHSITISETTLSSYYSLILFFAWYLLYYKSRNLFSSLVPTFSTMTFKTGCMFPIFRLFIHDFAVNLQIPDEYTAIDHSEKYLHLWFIMLHCYIS